MNRLAQFLVRHCRLLALLAIASAILPACYLPKLQIDNSIEVWLPRRSLAYRDYQEFLNRYGSDEFVVIAAEVPDPFESASIDKQRALAGKIRGIEGVDRVWDLPSLCTALWRDETVWRQNAPKSVFLRNLVLSPDLKTIGMFIWLKPLHGPAARRNVIEKLESAAANVSSATFQTHLAGAPRMNVALDRASAHDSTLFLPLAICVCVLALALLLKGISGVIAPMIAVGVSATWTVGLMVMSGHTLNAVTVVMPTLHFVLGLSNGIRLVSRYQSCLAVDGNVRDALYRSLRELMLPLFFMSFTMVVGFLSLLSSELEPIAELGLFSAIGLLVAFLSNVLIVPGVLSVLPKSAAGVAAATEHWSSRVGAVVADRSRIVLGSAVAILLLCAAAIPGLRTESNVLKFFPDDSEVSRDYRFIGQNLTGFYTVELDIQCGEDLAYDTIDAMKRMEKLIVKQPGVVRVDHIGKYEKLAGELRGGESQDSPFRGLSDRFYAESNSQVSLRMCVLVNAMGSSEYYPLLRSIGGNAQSTLPKDAKWKLTGIVSLLNDAQSALVMTQVRSFASAFVIIITMMGLLFRSLRAALASVLPNLLPVAMTFAFMAAVGICLDAATVMIASVAIGIAVDNTIYFLALYRAERLNGVAPDTAVKTTLIAAGRPIVYTSVVAAAGFGILIFAQFKPIMYFGALTAVTMLSSLAASLLITPACVRIFRLWDRI